MATLTSELMSSETTPSTTAKVKVPSRNMTFKRMPATRLLSESRFTPSSNVTRYHSLHVSYVTCGVVTGMCQHIDAMS